jgi:hypothetical protein
MRDPTKKVFAWFVPGKDFLHRGKPGEDHAIEKSSPRQDIKPTSGHRLSRVKAPDFSGATYLLYYKTGSFQKTKKIQSIQLLGS